MATLRPALGHAHHRPSIHPRAGTRRAARLRSGLLLGATTALAVTLLPGTAAAEPGRATSPQQAAQMVADASQQLEVVQEQVNSAREALTQQQAEADAAHQAADQAQLQLAALDGQVRQIARSAYTTGGNQLVGLDVMLTSHSADEFISQLGTLNAIAGHTNDVVEQVSQAAHAADEARDKADTATAEAQQTLDGIQAKQADLEKQVADYQRQYDALSAAQQAQVVRASSGSAPTAAAAAPVAASASAPAPTAAAQAAVNTALAQVGDPYVWGAAGPDSFDCSGLTQYAYAAAGISLPHSSSIQSTMGTPVSRDQLQPGDLIFFYSPVSHVAMYIGNGQMVHASTSGQPVKVVSVGSMPGYNSARRIATG